MARLVRFTFFSFFVVVAALFAAAGAFAQATCGVSSVPVQVRSHGLTERVGTIVLNGCTGTIGGSGASLTVTVIPTTATITNSPAAPPTATVSTTTGGVTSVTATVAGTISGSTVTFAIPATPGGSTLASIQIGSVPGAAASVAIRANVNGSGITFPSQMVALLSSSPAGALAIMNTSVNIAIAAPQPGLFASYSPGAPINQGAPPALSGVPQTTAFTDGAVPAFTATDTTTGTAVAASSISVASAVEGYPGALLVPGEPPAGNGEGADGSGIGTRILIRLANVPANVAIYAPQTIVTSTAGGTLTLALVIGADTNGSGGVVLAGPSPVTANLINGTTITYETTASNSAVTERVDIPLGIFTTGVPGAGSATATLSLAPVSSVTAAVPLGSAPIPRFADVPADLLTAPGPPTISLSASTFPFNVTFGGTPSPQILAVKNAGGGTLNWTATISSIVGGNWLTISPSSGTGDTNVSLSVNSAALLPGTYTATVLVSATGATNTPQTFTVTLIVSPTTLLVTPTSLSFSGSTGQSLSPQQVTISAGGTLNWTASVSTASGGSWLSISPSSGTTPGMITVSVLTNGLASGGYQGTITINAGGAANSPQVASVGLTVSAPLISLGGIVNGASFFGGGGISPGSIASIFGSNLAGVASSALALPLPTILSQTQVLVNESPIPLFYVSPTQINFEMPPGLPASDVQVVVVSNGVRGLAATVHLFPIDPGIFTVSASGSGQAAALNQDFSLNSAQNPASAGTIIQLYATGLGATNPPAVAGQAPSSLSVTTNPPIVLIGGIPAEVLFSGLAPGFVGAYQVNARIPATISASSSVPVQITYGTSPDTPHSNVVTIAVR